MLKKDNRFDNYAYRVATRDIDPSVTSLYEGSWVTLDATSGKVRPAAATDKVVFLCTTSERSGRDNVKSQGAFPKAAYYLGPFEVTVANDEVGDTAYDSNGTYGYLTPLTIKADSTTNQGILTPAGENDAVYAYSCGPADATAHTLRICRF